MLAKRLAFGLIILGVFPFAFAKGGNEDCWTCHARKGIEKITPGGARSSVYVDEKEYIASAHAGNLCTSCHDDIKEMPHPERLKDVKCRECHRLETEIYLNSSHGKAVYSGIKEAATCESCHGKPHSILNSRNEKSPVNRRNIPETCAVCHENEEKMKEFKTTQKTPVQTYRISVHGNAFKKDNISAAVCSDCHGTHDLHPPSDVKAKLYKFNVPGTCSKCHENENITYKRSIHGKAIESKRKEAPVCTDCHGEHKIFAFSDPDSSVYSSAVSDKTCAPCHVSEQIITKFELPADRVDTYKKSYHGIASKEVRNPAKPRAARGIGCVEAPRGTLIHDYETDANGLVTNMNIIVGTTHNNAPMNMSVKQAAVTLIRGGKYDQGLINRVEMAYRAYDPCFSCATHELDGRMAVKIDILDKDGNMVDTLKNF